MKNLKSLSIGKKKTTTNNIIPYPYLNTSMTSNGITWTDNGDGTITANGTAESDSSFCFQPFSVVAGTYILSGSPNITGCAMQLRVGTDDYSMKSVAGSTTTLTYTGTTAFTWCRCIVTKGTTVSNAVFKPQLERGNIVHDYTPYAETHIPVSVVTYGADYNSFITTGVYEIQGKEGYTTVNTPNGNHTDSDFYLQVFARSSKYVKQIAMSVRDSTTTYIRAKVNGNWTAWTLVKLTDTTYTNFVKSGSGAKSGLVPAPSTTAGTTKYLREDGNWSVPTNTVTTVVNNTTTTAAGYALDARQANPNVTGSLGAQISAVTSGLANRGQFVGLGNWYSSSKNASATITIPNIAKYPYILLETRYGSDVRDAYFIPSLFIINNMKTYDLYHGSALAGVIKFNSNTSVTFTQYEINSPMHIYGIY